MASYLACLTSVGYGDLILIRHSTKLYLDVSITRPTSSAHLIRSSSATVPLHSTLQRGEMNSDRMMHFNGFTDRTKKSHSTTTRWGGDTQRHTHTHATRERRDEEMAEIGRRERRKKTKRGEETVAATTSVSRRSKPSCCCDIEEWKSNVAMNACLAATRQYPCCPNEHRTTHKSQSHTGATCDDIGGYDNGVARS